MRRGVRRGSAAAGIALTVFALTGCIILPPEIPEPVPPTPTTVPQTQQPQTQQPTPSTLGSDEYVQPDEPVSDTDTTDLDTGVLYAGEEPITSDGYSPDAATNVVLDPTRGQPLYQSSAGLPDSSDGDEFMTDSAPSADGNLIQTTAGRLVLTATDGAQFTCSATVINSATQNIVLTAAHCVFDDDTREEMAEIEFVPAYRNGDAPFGTWQAEDWWYPEQYAEANDRWLDGIDDDGWMGFDFAFIRFAPNDAGQELEDVVGGQGVSFTAETNGIVTVGYPGNDPFDAEVPRYCADSTLNYGLGGDPNYGIDCDMQEGASGSAWISNVDPATGAGTITAVYSNGGTDDAYGPPLGVTAYNGLQGLEG